MSDQGTPKEECLYCHGINNFSGPCPGCGKALAPDDPRFAEVKRAEPLLPAAGNWYQEFSWHHPHV